MPVSQLALTCDMCEVYAHADIQLRILYKGVCVRQLFYTAAAVLTFNGAWQVQTGAVALGLQQRHYVLQVSFFFVLWHPCCNSICWRGLMLLRQRITYSGKELCAYCTRKQSAAIGHSVQ